MLQNSFFLLKDFLYTDYISEPGIYLELYIPGNETTNVVANRQSAGILIIEMG